MKKSQMGQLGCALLVALGAWRLYAAVTENSANVPLPIPDNGSVNSIINFPINATITDVDLKVSLIHTWNADVRLSLTGPSVAAQVLWQDCGASSDNLTDTVLDNDAAGLAACTFAAAPFTGWFQPTDGQSNSPPEPIPASGSLDAFDGALSGGVWTLTVADDSPICVGTLMAWSLIVDGAGPLPVELMNFAVE